MVEEFSETVHLAIIKEQEVVYLDKVDSDSSIRMNSAVGKRRPSYCTGVYYEATGHAKAYDYIYTIAQGKMFSEEHIKTIHRLFFSLIDIEKAGIYRQERVIITGSAYPTPAPDKIPNLMSAFVRWLVQKENKLHPVEFAALAHKQFVFIHPFIDGNGRVARLLMNLCLIRKGYTIGIIPPILRQEYISFLEKAHKDDKPFVKFITERVEETQKDLIRLFK